MKLILMMLALLGSGCSGENREATSKIHLEDGMKFVLFENGREVNRKMLTLSLEDQQIMESWIKSFVELSEKDYKSYAPVAILLGKKIKVNFQRNVTVISIKTKDDPAAVWNQYSRVPTKQDKEVEDLLKNLKELREGETWGVETQASH